MAWVGRIIKWGDNGSMPVATVAFYDTTDTGRASILAMNDFPIDARKTNAAIKNDILAWGAAEKALKQVASDYSVAFPVGTDLSPTIP